eukprot:TRINITY_DN42231_c0_g1_i1.p1 TRINITY_DN42231_c0_g1~~TRINITY_DN42231_c0_g1_i1.p1  ORF type:complete len:673 (+),score=78.79 TRINITY_DN42231_c0_g1_i1:36-2021(+)
MVPTPSQKRVSSRTPEVALLYSEAARDVERLRPAAERKSWSKLRQLATELQGRLGHIRFLDDTRKAELHSTLERTEAARTQLQGVQSHCKEACEKADETRAENRELRRKLACDAREFVSLLKSCSRLEEELGAIKNGEEDELDGEATTCEQPAEQLATSRPSSKGLALPQGALDIHAEKELLAALVKIRERLMKSSAAVENPASLKGPSNASGLEEAVVANTYLGATAPAAIPASESAQTSAHDCVRDVFDQTNARTANGDGEYSSDKSTADSTTARAEHTKTGAIDSSATNGSATIPMDPFRSARSCCTSALLRQEPWESPGPKPMAAAEEEAERIVQARLCASTACDELSSHPIFSERLDEVRTATSAVRRMSSSPEPSGSIPVPCDVHDASHRAASPVLEGAVAAPLRVIRRMSAPGGLASVRAPCVITTAQFSQHVMRPKVQISPQLTRQRTSSPVRVVSPVQVASATGLARSPALAARPMSLASLHVPRMASPVRAVSPMRLACSASASSSMRTSSPRLVPPMHPGVASPRRLYSFDSSGPSTVSLAQTIPLNSQAKPTRSPYRGQPTRPLYGRVSSAADVHCHTQRGLASRAVVVGSGTAVTTVTCRALSPQLPRGTCHRMGSSSLSKVGVADQHLEVSHSGKASSLASSTSVDC